MVYLINLICIVMRQFAFVSDDFIPDNVTPQPVEGHPCYQPSVYDSVLYEEDLDGNLVFQDMTQILLHQEKYVRLLGTMNVQNILSMMHPTQSTAMDGMTDEERFSCVISRHCQSMSERQAVLQQLASEHSELTELANNLLAETSAAPGTDPSAPAPSV